MNSASPGANPTEASPARPLSFNDAYTTLKGAQKSARGAPAYSRWVNRPIGRVLAAAAYKMGLVPNQVTAISALFTYSAILIIALVEPSVPEALLVSLLLLVGYALDSADGQLARLTRMGRPSGEWLDHVIDMGKICLLHGAVALSWFRWGVQGFEGGPWGVAIPMLFLTVSVVAFFGWLLSDLLVRVSNARASVVGAEPQTRVGDPQRAAPALRSFLRLPGDYGLLALTFAWFADSLFALTYTFLLAANTMILIAALPVWFRQVRAAEETA